MLASVKKLYHLLHIKKGMSVLLLMICVIAGVFHVGMSLLLAPMINNTIKSGAILWDIVAVYCIFSLIYIVIKYVKGILFLSLCAKTELTLNTVATNHLIEDGIHILETKKEGETAAVISKRITIFREFLESNLEKIIYTPIDFLLSFVGILIMDYRTGLIILPVIMIGIYVDLRFSNSLVKSANEAYNKENDVFSFQKEAVENKESIVLSNMTNYIINKHGKYIDTSLDANNQLTTEEQLSYIPALINEYLPTIVLIGIAIYKVSKGEVNYGAFVSILILISNTSLPFAHFMRALSKLKAKDPLMTELNSLNQNNTTYIKNHLKKSNELNGVAEQIVDIKDLVFRYDAASTNVLSNINLVAHRQQKIALIGSSGSGKTTLIKLIMGILSPTAGSVELFGVPAMDNHDFCWQHIGYVDNIAYLFEGSVEYNITLTTQPLSEVEKNLLDSICMKLKIEKLLENSMLIHQFGANLSGGEKLKICLARALFRKPKLLILDEPTAALDADTEKEFCDSLKNIQVATIISTHRKPLLSICDNIYEIKHGDLIAITQ